MTSVQDSGVPVCEAHGITHAYATTAGEVPVLAGVDLRFYAGELAAIVGPSGSGKSTLLSILGLLLRPTAGRLSIDGMDVSSMDATRRARFRADHVSFVFQAFHLVEHLTVEENVRLARAYSTTPGRANDDVSALVTAVGLQHRITAWPAQLSGGEKQRCAIARALNSDSRFLLCDEPTGNLDSDNSDNVIDILLSAAHEQGKAVVVITHDESIADRADVVYRVNDGAVREAGKVTTTSAIHEEPV